MLAEYPTKAQKPCIWGYQILIEPPVQYWSGENGKNKEGRRRVSYVYGGFKAATTGAVHQTGCNSIGCTRITRNHIWSREREIFVRYWHHFIGLYWYSEVAISLAEYRFRINELYTCLRKLETRLWKSPILVADVKPRMCKTQRPRSYEVGTEWCSRLDRGPQTKDKDGDKIPTYVCMYKLPPTLIFRKTL